MAITDNAVLSWKLDTDGSIPDASGNSKTGTIYGATYNASGKINGCYGLDGTNDEIISSSVSLGTQTSYAFWIKAATSQNQLYPVVLGNNTNKELRIYAYASGVSDYFYLATGNGSSWDTNVYTDVNVRDDSWHFIVITVDSGANERKIYIDGSLNVTNTDSCNLNIGTDTLIVGRRGGSAGYWYEGSFDNFTVFNRILTSTEVTTMWNSGDGVQWPFSSEPTGLNMKVNIGDSWKDVVAMKINIGDTWKDVVAIKQNIGDTWKDV